MGGTIAWFDKKKEEMTMPFEIPHSWHPYAKSIGASLIIVVVSLFVYVFLVRLLKAGVAKGALTAPVVGIFRVVIRLIIVSFAILFVLQEFGVLQNVWAAIVAVLAMVAIGFVAVWSVMCNITCTLLIIIYRMFLVGDKIEIPADSLSGNVVDLNLIYTTLRADDGMLIQVPNSTFFQKPIKRKPGIEPIDLWDQLLSKEPAE